MTVAARRTAAMLLAAVTYAAIGVVFAWPTAHVQMWRLAAWVVSAAVFTVHIGYERFGLHDPPARASLHVALAAALGAFGLAVAANIHSLSIDSATQHRRLLLLALALWPLITGLPAFVVALVASYVLTRITVVRGSDASPTESV